MMALLATALVMIFSFGSASRADAQVACGTMYDFCGWGLLGHELPGPVGDFVFPHTACEMCYVDEEYWPGDMCHGPCKLPLLEAAYAAARNGDTDLLLGIAPFAMKYVSVNFPLQAVQVRSCDGNIIASLPLPRTTGPLARTGFVAKRTQNPSLFDLSRAPLASIALAARRPVLTPLTSA